MTSLILKRKIKNKTVSVAIAGMGYVGLPLAKSISEGGIKKIYGIDINESKIKDLLNAKSDIESVTNNDLAKMLESGFKPTKSFSCLKKADVFLICVPTPLSKSNDPDLSYIKATLNSAKKFLHKSLFICLESTTYPGTTKELMNPIAEQLNFKIGKDIFVGYSPEREDPGNVDFSTGTIRRVVSGITKDCLDICSSFYAAFTPNPYPVSSTSAAELTKLIENIQRSVNISLMNEMKIIADKMGLNIFEVIEAASTKPFGFKKYLPGPGIGGHCIPIDPFYLTWKAKQYGVHTRFIELAGEINLQTISYVIDKTIISLNKIGISLSRSKILILGLSYKKNIADLRESPNLKILKRLLDLGSKVDYSDPFFKKIPNLRNFDLKKSSVNINKKNLQSYDLVLLLTDHDNFDFKLIKKESKFIIDTRGVYKPSRKIIHA